MPTIRNTSGQDRYVVAGFGQRLVLDGATLDVPAEDVYGYTQQDIWEPADDDAQKAHDAAVKAAEPPPEPPVMPAKNASRDVWAAYAVDAGLATTTDVEGLSRDDLVKQYGPQEG